MNAILDRKVQQKGEALPEYAVEDAFDFIRLVERIHDAAYPLFVKRSNLYVGETGSEYIAIVKVLADLAKLSEMDQLEPVKFKVFRDLTVKVREKVLRKQDMTLEAMTTLVAESEAMDLINASFRSKQASKPKKEKTKKTCQKERGGEKQEAKEEVA